MFTIIRISESSWQWFLWNITGPQQAFGLSCMHRLKRLIQPPRIDLQFNMKRSRSCPPFSSFPSRGLPVEISLQRLVSHFSGEKHLCVPGNMFKNSTPAPLILQGLLCDVWVLVRKDAKTWRQRTWVLALAQLVTSWAVWSWLSHLASLNLRLLFCNTRVSASQEKYLVNYEVWLRSKLIGFPSFSLGLFYCRLKISSPQFPNTNTSERQYFL